MAAVLSGAWQHQNSQFPDTQGDNHPFHSPLNMPTLRVEHGTRRERILQRVESGERLFSRGNKLPHSLHILTQLVQQRFDRRK